MHDGHDISTYWHVAGTACQGDIGTHIVEVLCPSLTLYVL